MTSIRYRWNAARGARLLCWQLNPAPAHLVPFFAFDEAKPARRACPAETCAKAELQFVVNYPRWRLRRKRN